MKTVFTNFRLLPLVMVMTGVLFCFKVLNLAEEAVGLLSEPGSAIAMPMDTDVETLAAIAPASGQEGDAGQGEAQTEDATAEAGQQDQGMVDQPSFMTKSEIDLLQDLSNRRQELDARGQQLDTRERLLMATEKRIDRKIERLKGIEADIREMLRIHDAEEEAQLQSLVKIYEAMKPKDAARIMDKMDMDVLLPVIERMKERKIAPLLAEMDPETAKALTIEMATRKQLPSLDEQG
jgi:flagellar motility protein MotE (MotC chaperone)